MGWLAELDGTRTAFKTDVRGHVSFHPFGIFGRGYVVPNEEGAAAARAAQRLSMLLGLALMIAASVFSSGYAGLLAASVVALGIQWIQVQRATAGWERSASRLTLRDTMPIGGRSTVIGLWTLVALSVTFVAVLIYGVVVLPRVRSWGSILAIAFFAGGGAMIAWRIRAHYADERARTSGSPRASR